MASSVEELFKEVRKACGASMWSKGVELVRAGAVAGVTDTEEEIVCRVRIAQSAIAPTVTLYPEDEEWDCDCPAMTPCCEHVAGAVIAVKRAHNDGKALPGDGKSGAHLAYFFEPKRGHLVMERRLVAPDGTSKPLSRNVTSIAAEASRQDGLTPSQGDIAIDRLMGQRLHGPLAGEALRGVLLTLAGAPHVFLSNKAIEIHHTPLKPMARVLPSGRGYRVVIDKDPRITDVLVPGVVRCGEAIHVLAETDLTGASLERVPNEQQFGPRQIMALVTEVIPGLLKRMPVQVDADKLPKVTRTLRPRLVLDVEQVGNTLSVLSTVWYGDNARVDANGLHHVRGDIPLRDEKAESGLTRRLREHLELHPGRRAIVSGDAAAALAEKLDAWSGEIRGRSVERFIERSTLKPSIELNDGAMSVNFAVTSTAAETTRTATAQAVLNAWQVGANLVPLVDGGWAPLPDGWLDRHGHRVAELLAAQQSADDQKLPTYALPSLAQLCDDLGQSRPAQLHKLAPLVEGFEAIPRAQRPAGLSATLRDYQERGVDWLCFLRDAQLGATLADDMGLGKTLQALCSVRGRTLVVCPRSVLHNWQSEANRFRPNLQTAIYHGPKRQLHPSADVTITTYAMLRIDQEQMSSVSWDTVILDEAQIIKNPHSQVTRAAYRLRAKFRLTLSGTPVENRLEELWSQFHFTNPGLLGSLESFQEKYATPIAEGREGAASRLRARIKPFLLRRLKREVARELPPRTNITVSCALSDRERELYDSIHAATQKDIVEQLQGGGSVLKALEALLRLRQAACHPSLVPGQSADGSSKTNALCLALDQAIAGGHKSLVFSQWTGFLDRIEPQLQANGIDYVRLDGSTRDRQALVDQFQSDDGPPVFLLSLMAGGTGLNLTAADHVFMMDLWWNPAVEEQAADRAHRIGQQRPVFVHRLVSTDTVEERIVELQERKKNIADAALGDASQAGGLTREDLLALLQ